MPESENKIETIKEFELRTEEVNEILSSTPKWIFRWGISVIFILIVVGISLSYFIRYPDILNAKIVLTTLSPPVTLVAKNNGKLTELLVKNNDTLIENQTLAVIENTADYKDVLLLDASVTILIDKLNRQDSITNTNIKDSLNVGELTPAYLTVLKSIKDAKIYSVINPYNKQITFLKEDLINYTSLLVKYQKQISINNEQLKLSETDYLRDKKLVEDKVISMREFETKKKEYLIALNSNEQSKITASNAELQKNSIEKSILQLQIQDYQEQAKLKSELQQSVKALSTELTNWKQKYLIASPVSGRVSFFNVWAINQNVKQGDELFAIVPNQKQMFIGKCTLPIANSGKLTEGQIVNIKLDNYPYNENGILSGLVSNISQVPTKDNYMIDVTLTNGLTTSYNKTLIYKEQMTGTADIITKNISVMDRIFFNFKKLLERK
jgi:multidrug resistance efflux pump